MASTADAVNAAPEWVRALQAALHADMEADDVDGDPRGGKNLNHLRNRYSSAMSDEIEETETRYSDGDREVDGESDVQRIISGMLAEDKKDKDDHDVPNAALPDPPRITPNSADEQHAPDMVTSSPPVVEKPKGASTVGLSSHTEVQKEVQVHNVLYLFCFIFV